MRAPGKIGDLQRLVRDRERVPRLVVAARTCSSRSPKAVDVDPLELLVLDHGSLGCEVALHQHERRIEVANLGPPRRGSSPPGYGSAPAGTWNTGPTSGWAVDEPAHGLTEVDVVDRLRRSPVAGRARGKAVREAEALDLVVGAGLQPAGGRWTSAPAWMTASSVAHGGELRRHGPAGLTGDRSTLRRGVGGQREGAR